MSPTKKFSKSDISYQSFPSQSLLVPFSGLTWFLPVTPATGSDSMPYILVHSPSPARVWVLWGYETQPLVQDFGAAWPLSQSTQKLSTGVNQQGHWPVTGHSFPRPHLLSWTPRDQHFDVPHTWWEASSTVSGIRMAVDKYLLNVLIH